MPEFIYHVDHKETIWRRKHICINAASQQEADDEIRQLLADDPNDMEPYEHEELLDTAEPMTPEDNGGDPTVEILRADSGNSIYNNVAGNINPDA